LCSEDDYGTCTYSLSWPANDYGTKAFTITFNQNTNAQFDRSYLADFANYVESLGQKSGQQFGGPRQSSGPDFPHVAKPELVSDWERVFYQQLWNASLRPIPQYAEEKFLLDFALFIDGRKLNIEVDGERYHRDWNGELLRRDHLRNMRMIELGWDVMRFWVYQLRDEMPTCVQRVQAWTKQLDREIRAQAPSCFGRLDLLIDTVHRFQRGRGSWGSGFPGGITCVNRLP